MSRLGAIDAYDPAGELLWSRPYASVGEVIDCPEDTACASVVVDHDALLVRVDAEGRERWAVPLGADERSSIVATRGTVAVLDCKSGEVTLHAASTGGTSSTSKLDYASVGDGKPTIAACRLTTEGAIAIEPGETIVAFDGTGRLRARFPVSVNYGAEIVYLEDGTFAVNGAAEVVDVDLRAFTATRRRRLGSYIRSIAAVGSSAPRSLYVLEDRRLSRVESNGAIAWTVPSPFGYGELAIGEDGCAAIIERGGGIAVFDATGTPRWAYAGADPTGGPLVVRADRPTWAVPLAAGELVSIDTIADVTLASPNPTRRLFGRGDALWALKSSRDPLSLRPPPGNPDAAIVNFRVPLMHLVDGAWIDSPPLSLEVSGFDVHLSWGSAALDEDGTPWIAAKCEIPEISYGGYQLAPPAATNIIGQNKLWHLVDGAWLDVTSEIPARANAAYWTLTSDAPFALCPQNVLPPIQTLAACVARTNGKWLPLEVTSPAPDESLAGLWNVGAERWLATSARLSRAEGSAPGGTLAPFDVAEGSPRGVDALWGASESSVWASADGRLWRWDGATFRWSLAPTHDEIHELTGSADDDVWARTVNQLLHFDGRTWRHVAVPHDAFYASAIRSAGRDAIWAASERGLFRVRDAR